MATTFVSIYSVPGADLETLYPSISHPHHKVGGGGLILLISKTKQNWGLANL